MLICMMQLCCLQVTVTIDDAVENTHFILQPIRISDAAEMHPRHVQDMSINDAAVNLLCCLQVATTLDAADQDQPGCHDFGLQQCLS